MEYRICVKEQLDPSWQSWFEGLIIEGETSKGTSLSGIMPDQAALYGVLLKIARLGLTLVSLETVVIPESEQEERL